MQKGKARKLCTPFLLNTFGDKKNPNLHRMTIPACAAKRRLLKAAAFSSLNKPTVGSGEYKFCLCWLHTAILPIHRNSYHSLHFQSRPYLPRNSFTCHPWSIQISPLDSLCQHNNGRPMCLCTHTHTDTLQGTNTEKYIKQ